MLRYSIPRWYQELSIPQMKCLLALGKIIKYDHEETVAGRTQKCLWEMGITSTFVKISSKELKKIFKISELDPTQFLCEIYRYITGRYFEEEGYKKVYDCNERIVLSAIAFLKFPETILELHRRLPMGKPTKLPKKPKPPQQKAQKSSDSPYLEEIGQQCDWRKYRNQLQKWREKVNGIVKPSAILPIGNENNENIKSSLETNKPRQIYKTPKIKIIKRKRSKNIKNDKIQIEEIGENILEEENKFDDYLSEINLFLKDRPKKFYPPGIENLSRNWQSWLHDRDNEFEKYEKEADYILDRVREITKLIFNPNACENCCACRQSRMVKLKKQEAKVPLMIINSLISDDNKNKNVIGSLMMNSPIPSPTNSLLNLPQIIPSKEKIIKKKIINGITIDETGTKKCFISQIIKDIQHTEKKIRYLPVPIKNVPSCNCKNYEEIDETNPMKIPCAIDDGTCMAKHYKSNEFVGCKKCHDEHYSNKIYRDFEKNCKERENRKKKLELTIDNKTCTEKLFNNEEIILEIESEQEKCVKCIGNAVKCKTNPFKEIINEINKNKLLNRPKVTKQSEIKEYRDNIKFNVNGIVQSNNPDNKITGCILSGITLHTPITITPVTSSESELSYTTSNPHHHWSITNFTPKPKQNKITKPINKIKKNLYDPIQNAIDELFEKVRQFDHLKVNLNDKLIESNEKTLNIIEKNKKDDDDDDKIKKFKVTTEREKGGGGGDSVKGRNNDKQIKEKLNLPKLMKIALNEMADEGFILPKLPHCHKLPQLQVWIMFREGFVLTKKQKNERLLRTQHLWSEAEQRGPIKIPTPSFHISKNKKEKLTSTDLRKIEKQFKHNVKIFHSKVRKLRVLESRAMWNLMDYQMSPSYSFKQAYFIYQASKESDGHVERPYGYTRTS